MLLLWEIRAHERVLYCPYAEKIETRTHWVGKAGQTLQVDARENRCTIVRVRNGEVGDYLGPNLPQREAFQHIKMPIRALTSFFLNFPNF